MQWGDQSTCSESDTPGSNCAATLYAKTQFPPSSNVSNNNNTYGTLVRIREVMYGYEFI